MTSEPRRPSAPVVEFFDDLDRTQLSVSSQPRQQAQHRLDDIARAAAKGQLRLRVHSRLGGVRVELPDQSFDLAGVTHVAEVPSVDVFRLAACPLGSCRISASRMEVELSAGSYAMAVRVPG